jgi:PAB1-binding protein PBP1
VLTIHHVFDEGSQQFWDVEEFTPVDEDGHLGEGRSLGAFNTPGGSPARCATVRRGDHPLVNQGMIDHEYGEHRNAQTSKPPGVDPDHRPGG